MHTRSSKQAQHVVDGYYTFLQSTIPFGPHLAESEINVPNAGGPLGSGRTRGPLVSYGKERTIVPTGSIVNEIVKSGGAIARRPWRARMEES
jgi:hypothetical protein